jgi:hypothetical protein
MLDLLIDLMASVSAMQKALTREAKLRQIQECMYSLKAIENRLQKTKEHVLNEPGEDSQISKEAR